MASFTLTFDDDGQGEPKRVEFTANDCHQAFHILEQEKSGRRAVLWEGGRRVGTLQRDEAGFWHLAS